MRQLLALDLIYYPAKDDIIPYIYTNLYSYQAKYAGLSAEDRPLDSTVPVTFQHRQINHVLSQECLDILHGHIGGNKIHPFQVTITTSARQLIDVGLDGLMPGDIFILDGTRNLPIIEIRVHGQKYTINPQDLPAKISIPAYQ